MSVGFLSRLSTDATLGDLPGHRAALRLSDRGKAAGDLFATDARLPGILLGEEGRFQTAVSRRYYLDAIGRYCGMDLYHPRPLRFLMTRYDELGGPLVLPAATPIAEAVRRGLERPRERVYEPLVVAKEALPLPLLEAVRLVDFEDLLVAASRLTSLRAGHMRQILASVREGLLLLDLEQRVAPEYSDSVETLLGVQDLAGRRFAELLATCLDPERAELAGDFVDTLYNPRVIESLVEKVNPLLRVETTHSRRVLAFRFARRLEQSAIAGVLVRIEDVTREDALGRDLERERARAEETLQLALALAQAEPPQVAALLERVRTLGAALRRTAEPGDVAWVALRRELHGAKGDAALLGLAPLAAALHEAEEALDPAAGDDGAARRAGARRLEAVVANADAVLRRFAGPRRESAPAAPTAPSAQRPRGGATGPDTATAPALATLLAQTERFVATLAADLERPARFVHRLPADLLDGREVEPLREVLAQLVRNAFAHGLESPSERARAGKPACATLQLVGRPHAAGRELVFQDDGRGLDHARIRDRAAALGLAGVDPQAAIFRPGFSTAATVDAHAGRGVGLDLVAARVRALGGRLAVHSEPGRLCAFRVLLPPRAEGP